MSGDSSEEEPSPEALKRYQSMRRHTVGMADPSIEITDHMRAHLQRKANEAVANQEVAMAGTLVNQHLVYDKFCFLYFLLLSFCKLKRFLSTKN